MKDLDKPKHQDYRVCCSLTGETLYELHKICKCENCQCKLKYDRLPPNQATVTTKDISKVDEVAEFLRNWNCKDNTKQPSKVSSIGKEPNHVVATITYYQF